MGLEKTRRCYINVFYWDLQFFWQNKTNSILWTVILFILLGYRMYWYWSQPVYSIAVLVHKQ